MRPSLLAVLSATALLVAACAGDSGATAVVGDVQAEGAGERAPAEGAASGEAGADHAAHAGEAAPEQGHDRETPPVVDGAREIAVTGDGLAFQPAAIDVLAGEDVAIVLTSVDAEHDFVIDEVGFHVHAGVGETAAGGLRIDEPGTYTAYCSIPGHRAIGMEIPVTVNG